MFHENRVWLKESLGRDDDYRVTSSPSLSGKWPTCATELGIVVLVCMLESDYPTKSDLFLFMNDFPAFPALSTALLLSEDTCDCLNSADSLSNLSSSDTLYIYTSSSSSQPTVFCRVECGLAELFRVN